MVAHQDLPLTDYGNLYLFVGILCDSIQHPENDDLCIGFYHRINARQS